MTQVVSPHVGGTAAIVSCEGCQLMHPATAIVLEQQVNVLSADAQK
jgi:hypothetical protein